MTTSNPDCRVSSAREWVRYRVGWWASEPFWRLFRLGERAERVHARILDWAERDNREAHYD